MKKMTNRLLSLGMAFIAAAALTIPVLAADAVVRRDGTSGLVIETTGSGYTDTDLFNNFKDVMPGDERTETITIKNSVNGFDYVKLYIRAVPHDEQGNPLTYDEKYENADGKAVLRVADDGPGIAPEDQDKVWQRFWQADPSHGEDGGCGLGLAMVKEIVQFHGGSVALDSTPGKGSTFSVTI